MKNACASSTAIGCRLLKTRLGSQKSTCATVQRTQPNWLMLQPSLHLCKKRLGHLETHCPKSVRHFVSFLESSPLSLFMKLLPETPWSGRTWNLSQRRVPEWPVVISTVSTIIYLKLNDFRRSHRICGYSTQRTTCQGAPMRKASSPAGFTNHRATFHSCHSSHKTLHSCSYHTLLSILEVSPSLPPIGKSIQLESFHQSFHPHVSS